MIPPVNPHLCDWCELPIDGRRWYYHLSTRPPLSPRWRVYGIAALMAGYTLKPESRVSEYSFHRECLEQLDDLLRQKVRGV